MNRIWIVAWHEYLTNLRRPGFIFFTLVVPAIGLAALIIGAFFSGQATRFFTSQFGPETRPIGIVDGTHLFTPIRPGYTERYIAYPDELTARRALLANQIGTYLVIPEDYVATGKITSYSKQSISAATADSSVLRSYLVEGLLSDKLDRALVARVSRPAIVTPVTLNGLGEPEAGGVLAFAASFLAPYLLSVMLVVSIFVSSSYLLRSVSEEKETRVIEVVLSSVSATTLLGGKVIGLGALGLTQVLVWLGSAVALSGGMGALIVGEAVALNPAVILLAVIYFILGYVVFAIIMATAGSLGTSMRESQQLAGIVSSVAAIPYMMSGLLFVNPNAAIARVLSYFPLTAPTMMLLRIPLGTVPTVDIVGSIAVLLLSIPLLLWMGARLFRLGLLMYGKRPGLAEILRTLRQT